MTKPRPYRGKHPTRINTVSGVSGISGVLVILNNGTKYIVRPISPAGRGHMPKIGECFTALHANDYSSAQYYAPVVDRAADIVFKVGATTAAGIASLGELDGHFTVTIYNRKTDDVFYTRKGIATFAAAYAHAVSQTVIIRREETQC